MDEILMWPLKKIGYMPAYGLNDSYSFTKLFPHKISVCFDNVNADPDADINVLVQNEPPNLYIKFYSMVVENQSNFDLILSYDPRILQLPNAIEFCNVGSWISDNIVLEKRNQISFLMSSKINGAPYRMRYKILRRHRDTKNIGPFEFKFHRSPPMVPSKDPFFANAKFNIACENQDMPNMFTEKLLDCFRTFTVPIYFGCTNIEKYFNIKGILQFRTIEEFDKIVNNLQPDMYDSMMPYIQENFELARPYWEKNAYQRIEEAVENFISLNCDRLNTFIKV
jgi:hypothetical protein